MVSKHSAQQSSPSRIRGLLVVLTAVTGILLGGVSWILRQDEPWWSNLLANMAVVVLLLIPGELLLAGMRRRVETVETTAARANAVAEKAQQSAEATARTLVDIQETLVDRQKAELEDEISIYRNIINFPGRDSLLTALRKATRDGLITDTGVRVPVWETDAHYRFVLDSPGDEELTVQLEQDDGTVIFTTPWASATQPEEFYQSLVLAVRRAGFDLGTGLNLPTQSVEELANMLMEVTKLRSQELAGYRGTMRKIIERRNGWYFTEDRIIVGEKLSYDFTVDRIDEIDWEEHLRGKGWYSASDALEFARRLYGLAAREDNEETAESEPIS